MPGYVKKALKQFQHPPPAKKQHAPFQCARINYGAKKQYATQSSTVPPLDKKGKKYIRMIDDEDIAEYQSVAGVRGMPKYTILWKGKRWSPPQPDSHFGGSTRND